MYCEIALYAMAVCAGIFKHKVALKDNYTVRPMAAIDYQSIRAPGSRGVLDCQQKNRRQDAFGQIAMDSPELL